MGDEKQPQKKNNQKTRLIVAILITCILGAITGVFYIDTNYGNGKIMAYFAQYKEELHKEKTTEPKQDNEKKDSSSKTEEQSTKGDSAKESQTKEDNLEERQIEPNSMIEIGSNSKSCFATFGKQFLMCTKDGVKFFAGMGDQKWNDTFTMTNPFLVQEGSFVAVGDIGGRMVRVYNQSGLQSSIQTEGVLVFLAMNTNGYLATITKEKNAYKVMIYKEDGTELKGRIEETEGVYPLAVDISDDNRVFAISYLDSSDMQPIGRILYFYINSTEGEEYTDSMFAAMEKEDEIIPIISFMEEGILAAISDHGIYGVNCEGKEIWKKELTNYLEFTQISKQNITVALGKELPNKEGCSKGTVLWIGTNGKEKGQFQKENSISFLRNSNGGTIIGNRKEFYGVDEHGKIFWQYTATGDVYDMQIMEKEQKVLYVNKNNAEILDMNQQGGDNSTFEKWKEHFSEGKQTTSQNLQADENKKE